MGWIVYLFYNKNKTKILKIMEFNRIKDISYVLDIKPSIISNFYHKFINPRGILQYIYIYRV